MSDLDALLTAARDDDPRVRQDAALRLGALPAPTAAPELVGLLRAETDDFVLETLTWAVVSRRDAVVPHLLDALDHTDDPARILHTLSKLEKPETAGAIEPFAHDPRPQVAAKAWWALARVGVPATLGALAAHVGVSDPPRRQALTRAFVHLSDTPEVTPTLTALFTADAPATREHALDIAVRCLDPDARGTRGRRLPEPAHLTDLRTAVRTTEAPEARAVLTQLSLEFQHPPLAEAAAAILRTREKGQP